MPILTPGERLGQYVDARYRLDTILSSGGMGVLFAGLDVQTGRPVAVKMLKPAYACEPDKVARFVRETRIALELRHPHIAPVLDVWTDEADVPFLIMELLEGHSLAKELEARGTLPVDEALAIAIPVANALAAAHAMGVVHRDVKPGNIFLCRAPRDAALATSHPMLLDFGIAKCLRGAFETETGLVFGTPGYMAPEQAQYGDCGPFTDVWGLGAVLYRCLMGYPPHGGRSVHETLRMLLREPVAPVAADGVSGAVGATIDRALARDPHLRYASMEAFAVALTAAAAGRGDEPATDAFPSFVPSALDSEPRARWPAGAARLRTPALLGLGLLGAGLLFVTTGAMEARRVDRRLPPTSRLASDESRTQVAREPSIGASPGENANVGADPARGLGSLLPPPGHDEVHAWTTATSGSPARAAIRSSGPSTREVPSQAHPAKVAATPSADIEREPGTGLPIVVQW